MRTFLALVAVLTVGGLGKAPAHANPAQESRTCSSKDERFLLNLRLNLPALDFWDSPQKEWRSDPDGAKPGSAARVRIVHLWSTTCKPCEAEFPLLKQMDGQLRADYRGEVQFVYIADAISTSATMREFMERSHPVMPVGLLFRDRENKISAALMRALPAGPVEEHATMPSERFLSLPMTLLLDEDNVVRQVFVGSLLNRRGEFVNGLAQLYEALPGGAGKAKLVSKKAPVSL